jgi:hypothetical protein
MHDLCVVLGSQSTLVFSNPLFQGIEEILIDQRSNEVIIWVENSDHTMVCLHTTIDFPMSGVAPTVPPLLLPTVLGLPL